MKSEQLKDDALDWIHSLSRFGIKPGLERIKAMLEMLGNPHQQIRFVHIAGTNGKGSTAAMLASILKAAGYRVGLYTSPYLQSFSNRMAINGHDISHEELVELVGQVRPVVEEVTADERFGQPTEFEVVTLLALTYFARRQVDPVVLEVGLGGRLDATNAVTPLLSIITNVSLDHTDVLGDTVEAVAAEKAGIIKPDVPVLTASDDRKVLEIISSRASELNAPLFCFFPPHASSSREIKSPAFYRQSFTDQGQTFTYRGYERSFDNLFIPLLGAYQLCNAATALAALELLENQGIFVEEDAVRRGLSATIWPGRLELLKHNPLLVVDGAHNPAAMKHLAEAIPDYFSYRRLILVFGMMADKNALEMMFAILPLSDMAIFTKAGLPRAADPGYLAGVALHQLHYEQRKIKIVEEIGPALETGLSLADAGDLVLVTGSFYTVSDARAYWKQTAR